MVCADCALSLPPLSALVAGALPGRPARRTGKPPVPAFNLGPLSPCPQTHVHVCPARKEQLGGAVVPVGSCKVQRRATQSVSLRVRQQGS